MREKFARLSVATKFTVILTTSILLAGLLTGNVLIRRSTKAHYNSRVETLSVAAKMLAVHLDEYMNRLITDMDALTKVFGLIDEENKEKLLQQFISQRPELQATYYESSEGQSYVSGQWLGTLNKNNVNAEPGVVVEPVLVYTDIPILTVCVHSTEGDFLCQVNLNNLSLQQSLQDIKLGESGQPYLLNDEGVIISHRYSRYVGQRFDKLITMKDGSSGDIDLLTAATFSNLEYTLDHTERMAGIVPLPRLGLIVGFSQEIKEIERPVLLLRQGLGFLSVLLTIVVLSLGVLLGRMVTHPLDELTKQLKEIHNGHICSLTGGGKSPEITLVRSAVNKLIKSLHETSLSSVASLALALEAKDTATKGHSQRVAEIATLIGETMVCTAKSLRILARAAMLHDIGKIAIPDAILFKADRLSDEENELIRMHPQIAKRMLSPLLFLQEEIEIIEQHHEWVNGCGYPKKLTGAQIHPLAKILAVADAYEAMTANRPYRKALTSQEAMKQLLAGKGSQFDETVVNKFEEFIERRRYYYGGRGIEDFIIGREGA